jgi:protein ImuB
MTHGGAPDEAPLVLAASERGAQRIAAANAAALTLGLTPGLGLADARARVPHVHVADHDPAADTALLDRIAEDCDRWTPLVALDPPQGLILDVTGCAHLFGGEGSLRQRVLQRLHRVGLHACATIAGTPEAARALARFGQAEIVTPGAEPDAVRSLPIAALDVTEEVRVALARAGLKRIGDLADRPSAPLAARFGPDLPVRLRRVMGHEDRRITPLRPLPACLVEQVFAEPIAHADDVAGTLQRLIARACLVLEERGEGGRTFEASLFRADGAVARLGVATGRPSRDMAAIWRLFRERMDALADPLDPGFGFDLIRLAVPKAETLAPIEPSLDGHVAADEELGDLVDRLTARFGAERVLRLSARDTHDPNRTARARPAAEHAIDAASAAWLRAVPGEPPLRPLRLFEPPQPIETLAEVPDGPPIRFRWRRVLHEVARAEGPERIAAEWWRDADAPTRDYYRVEDAQGRRFWVYRAGLYDGAQAPRWYMHGLFA